MKLSLERAFRVIWLVVGGLLLLFLVAGGVMILSQVIGNAGAGEEARRVATEGTPQPRTVSRVVRYGMPERIRGTASTRIVRVDGDAAAATRSDYYSGESSAWANAVFIDDAGARVLLDRPAYISSVRYPSEHRQGPNAADSLQTWITYVMALDDSNGDGKLDSRDDAGLYVTDLEGRNLRPVLRPPLRLHGYQAMEGGRMLVYALEPPPGRPVDERRMPQRAFVYDVASGRLSPYAALDSAAARAGQILVR